MSDDGSIDLDAFDQFSLTQPFSDDNFPDLIPLISEDALNQIDQVILAAIPEFQDYQNRLNDTYDSIQQGQQLAFAYSGNLRRDDGNDDHRVSLIYDRGLSSRISWTVNASFDFTNRHGMSDIRAGRAATEFMGQLTPPQDTLWGRTPITLSFGAEGKWKTENKPTYTIQAKLTIPVSPGMDLPLVYRYSNRTDISEESDPELRFGLSLDLGRLGQLFGTGSGSGSP